MERNADSNIRRLELELQEAREKEKQLELAIAEGAKRDPADMERRWDGDERWERKVENIRKIHSEKVEEMRKVFEREERNLSNQIKELKAGAVEDREALVAQIRSEEEEKRVKVIEELNRRKRKEVDALKHEGEVLRRKLSSTLKSKRRERGKENISITARQEATRSFAAPTGSHNDATFSPQEMERSVSAAEFAEMAEKSQKQESQRKAE